MRLKQENSPNKENVIAILDSTIQDIFHDIDKHCVRNDGVKPCASNLNNTNGNSITIKEDPGPGITLEFYPEETALTISDANYTSLFVDNVHPNCLYNDLKSFVTSDGNDILPMNNLLETSQETTPSDNENHNVTSVDTVAKCKRQKKSSSIPNGIDPIIQESQKAADGNYTKRSKQIANAINHSNHHKTQHELNDSSSYITLNKKAVKKAIKLLSTCPNHTKKEKYQMTKFRRTCQEGYSGMLDLINWQSYAYTARAIRNLILNREWGHLSEMLRVMIKQKKIFKNYVKEITYLYYLINADIIDPMEVDEYFQLCFSSWDKSKKVFREFDIWYKNVES